MAADKFPLTPEEFHEIYAKVPRLTVEVLLTGLEGVYLTKRAIEPCKGQWHLPGGTVYFGESIRDAIARVAQREIGVQVEETVPAGFIEYPSHYRNKLDHPFGMVFEVTRYTGRPAPNQEAEAAGWFKELPANTHADQDVFLRSYLGRTDLRA